MISKEDLTTAAVSLGETVVNSPRTTLAASTVTASLGVGRWVELFQGPFSLCAIIVGVLATLALARKNWIDGENSKLQNILLRHQVKSMGAEPITEDIK